MRLFLGTITLSALALVFFVTLHTADAEASGQVRQRGAALYAEHCAVCHGETGQGLSEARLAFPEDHRRCESCHRPHNPPQMDLQAMHSRSAFSIGDAPALLGEGALANFSDEGVLRSYIRATMPRPFPGSLSEQDYADLSAFLLQAP